ncbi:nucleolar mif4g domain-containing protein 1 [Stylonychia lemnae]|uniref:Nucleolar mif4g domain-containing protein 1 n=1 Tax=Stylonychia lemnae TaxID=5949 RepID=A0A078AWS7_STYLE|nr:nucleolar mif4g domain-containing protein 1 [Stylonychia lemnae]|eukprot:CDW86880.1 nucleolar mif4g domain-containing protein 1 [Stylonychia lemnae]
MDGSKSGSNNKKVKPKSGEPVTKFQSRKDKRRQQKQEKKQKHLDYFQSRTKKSQNDYRQQQKQIQNQKKLKAVNLSAQKETIPKQQESILGKRKTPDTLVQKAQVKKLKSAEKQEKMNLSADREEFLRQNEIEKKKLELELKMLEKKLGIKNDPKKRKKVNQAIEVEGYGTGFMDFLDGIENKIKSKKEVYRPQDYEFSDGEGPEEGDILMGQEDEDHQVGFDEEFSEDEDASNDNQAQIDDEDNSNQEFDQDEEEGEEDEDQDQEDEIDDGEESEDDDNDDEEEEEQEQEEDDEEEDEDNNEAGILDDESEIEDDLDEFYQQSSDSNPSIQESEEEEEKIQVKLKQNQNQNELSKKGKQHLGKNDKIKKQESLQLENPAIEKAIRSVLNKVSEGNLEIMFNKLIDETKGYFKNPITYAYCYAKIFIQMSISLQQQMNAILSVNCAFICALHRIIGDQFFVTVVRQIFKEFKENHALSNTTDVSADQAKDKVKNILNCFLHFFLFSSLSSSLLIDVIKILMKSFEEIDIEVLIFLLHNIGLQLRKADPEAIRDIIQMAESKKNSYAVEIKMVPENDPVYANMKKKERKIGFLNMELQDIKNNKGTTTLQVKSIDHLQTWLKKNSKIQSELTFQAVDLKAEVIDQFIDDDSSLSQKWWLPESDKAKASDKYQKPRDFKGESKQASDIIELAKTQHMNTDIKKAVFQAIVGAEDYIQAFENCTRLNLKKQQEREIIKVLLHCCVNEKGVFNKFYALLAQRLCKFQPQSYRYSLKYSLWDYLKTLSKFDIRQIANLAKLFAFLIGENELPLHFLKVLQFDELSKPQNLFLYVLLDDIYERQSKDQIKIIFKKGMNEKHSEFRKGLSEYILTKYYLKKKKDLNGEKMSQELQTKIKTTFDIINQIQESEFMNENERDSD